MASINDLHDNGEIEHKSIHRTAIYDPEKEIIIVYGPGGTLTIPTKNSLMIKSMLERQQAHRKNKLKEDD